MPRAVCRSIIPQRFGLDPVRDIQVVCPMARGGVGVRSLNIDLQAALNPDGTPRVEIFGWTFAPDDKVMQIENDYNREVYNADIGFIEAIDAEEAEITVRFHGRDVTYGLGARRVGAGLCGDDPRSARLGISRRGDPGADAAPCHAAAEPALHRHHPGQADGGAGRQPQGGGDRGAQHLRPKAMIEAWGMTGGYAGAEAAALMHARDAGAREGECRAGLR